MAPGQAVNGRGETVLVVDDDDLTRLFVSHVLTRNGYQVVTCSDGRAAVDAHHSGVAIVVTDMVMREFDGTATARAIRERDPAAKIVGMSGYSVDNFPAANLNAFLSKPYTALELLTVVRKVLDA